MPRCLLCFREIAEDQPSLVLAEDLAGGGPVHQECWDALLPWAKRLIDEDAARERQEEDEED